jgi:hypothetical protein
MIKYRHKTIIGIRSVRTSGYACCVPDRLSNAAFGRLFHVKHESFLDLA